MTEDRLALFKAELREQWRDILRIHNQVEERLESFKETQEKVDSMGYKLHNLYCAYEGLFEIVARYFENQVEPSRYHVNLLKRMKLEIEGVRPALVTEESYMILDELRRFRHFFRHAYGVELDPERVEAAARRAVMLRVAFERDMERFIKELEG